MEEQIKKQQQEQQKQKEIEEQRRIILKEFMTPQARERLSTLALVKPEKAARIEDHIIQNVSRGVIKSKIDEHTLISFMEQVQEAEAPTKSIKFIRKKNQDDDELDIDSMNF